MLALAAMEHRLALSNLVWLQIVQEIGKGQTLPDASWDRIERWSAIATDLDPLYFTIYHTVGINLSVWGHRVEASDRVLLRGLDRMPERWELMMVLGYNAYFVHGDARLGSDYIAQAAQVPGAPMFLAPLAGRMRFQGGDELGAIALLETMMVGLEGRALEEATARLAVLRTEPRLRAYDAACKAHLEATGQMPTTQQVFDEGRVTEPPVDLAGHELTFDEKCITRSPLSGLREFEARARLGSLAKTATRTPDEQQLDVQHNNP